MLFVPDASVVCRMHFKDEEDSGLAEFFLRRFNRDVFAPDIILFEFASAMQKGILEKRVSASAGRAAMSEIADAVRMLVPSPPLLPPAFDMATALPHPVYDCVYLALAERDNAMLVTADAAFLRKLKNSRWREFAAPLHMAANF